MKNLNFSNKIIFHFLILLTFIINPRFVFARPSDESLYIQKSQSENRFFDLPPSSIVEGSVTSGGLQPDYIIDYENPAFDSIREFSLKIKKSDKKFEDKIKEIVTFIQSNVLRHSHYDDTKYLNIMEQYRNAGIDIPLSEYVKNRVGVCREHALITHYALKEAGIPNYYLYITAQLDDAIEDHAVNIVEYKNKKWIVDSYNKYFDGLEFNEAKNGLTYPKELLYDSLQNGSLKSIKKLLYDSFQNGSFRSIKKINEYPKAWFLRSETKPIKNALPLNCQTEMTKFIK